MIGAVLACAILANAAPVPPTGVPVAPPPRLVKPDLSLIVVELASKPDGTSPYRLVRVGIRHGTLLPAETVWEGDQRFLGHFGVHRLVTDRYLVTPFGGVIDIHNKTVISEERDGIVEAIDGMKVIYRVENDRRERGVYSFDIATGTLTKLKRPIREWRHDVPYHLAPDGRKTIEWTRGEIFLLRENEKPKSLGKGFRSEEPIEEEVLRSGGPMSLPFLWLDSDSFLTQHANGKLVAVDLVGKVTEVVTITDAPKKVRASLARDRFGAIFYSVHAQHYKIDVVKKTWEKSEWQDLGHGFEATWEAHEKFGYKLRHKGKEIGSFHCTPYSAKTAPGYIALKAEYGRERVATPQCVAIWSATRGEWERIRMYPMDVVGWIK